VSKPLHPNKLALTLLLASVFLNMGQSAVYAQHLYPTAGQSEASLNPESTPSKIVASIASLPVKSGLAAYDNTPLEGRMPLVLVHGIGETESKLFHWDNFLAFSGQNKAFQQRYKIYLYHYDSTRSVPQISEDLQSHLKRFIQSVDGRNIKILAYSEGGLLVRNAEQDAYLDQHTAEVIAIATPFHGSPLANPEWLQQQVKMDSPLSLVRMAQKVAYQITGRKYPTFRQDFRWDNFDGAIPAAQYLKNNGPTAHVDYALAKKKNFVTYGSYFGMEVDPAVLPRELGLKTPPPQERPMLSNLFRKNFLFSLVRNNIGKLPLANRLLPKETASVKMKGTLAAVEPAVNSQLDILPAVAMNAMSVGDTLSVALPREMASKNIVLAVNTATKSPVEPMNASIDTAKMELAGAAASILPPEPGVTVAPLLPSGTASASPKIALKMVAVSSSVPGLPLQPVSMMMFNDGISPISSTLWLGRYMNSGTGVGLSVDGLWDTLRSLKGNRNTRLFAGLDHRNWMDGTTRTGEGMVQDLLNPDEPPRTVFEWILYDLMS
jgi:triacylglycerol esterase/lipase EstA (alpha/beta hydrolase family)